ncbi:MAG: DegT/DnrJ/EryC1/StrS aminotransferase family protein, partial [Acidobacteriia bacterium]|nr:DegT/DnrJ/EryC1/StrS aminotransferase family protein [Terriglobia bacterium]
MLTTSIAAFAAVLAIVRIGAVPVFADVDGFDLADLEACDGILRDSHSLDLRWRGEATVSVGEFAATSFYPTKNLGSLGDGGAILTNAGELADSAFEEHA